MKKEREERQKMEKLEEEKSKAKLEMSKKLETIQVQKETGAAVSEEF